MMRVKPVTHLARPVSWQMKFEPLQDVVRSRYIIILVFSAKYWNSIIEDREAFRKEDLVHCVPRSKYLLLKCDPTLSDLMSPLWQNEGHITWRRVDKFRYKSQHLLKYLLRITKYLIFVYRHHHNWHRSRSWCWCGRRSRGRPSCPAVISSNSPAKGETVNIIELVTLIKSGDSQRCVGFDIEQ